MFYLTCNTQLTYIWQLQVVPWLSSLSSGHTYSVQGRGRFVDVGVFPMGIDVGTLIERRREPDVSYWVQLLRERYAGMMIVVGGINWMRSRFRLRIPAWPELLERQRG
ncbi:hypothetical protein DFH29DRAFT_497140 [Suillus ampliporus]|nr:hypothetical protein DFH29DRAFT_497140 [Suillus ampliporus]